jgi:hypothetical protein
VHRERYARAFIRKQMGDYQLAGVTTVTLKQRERIERLDVVELEAKAHAAVLVAGARVLDGRPPHQSTGRMRVLNMRTGELKVMAASTREGR